MRILTAIAARNIATNFKDCAMKQAIKEIMEKIYHAALLGQNSIKVEYLIKNDIHQNVASYEMYLSVMDFLTGLEYSVSESHNYACIQLTISWTKDKQGS